MLKTYISDLEIKDLNRYVESLPISLDTYKYLKDEPYMLVSEYVQISEIPEDNKITFKIKNDNTFFKLYMENDNFFLKMKEKTT